MGETTTYVSYLRHSVKKKFRLKLEFSRFLHRVKMYRQEAPDLNLSDIRRYFDNICITGIPVSPTGSNRTIVMDQECQNREHKPRKEKCQGCNPSKMPYLVVSINLWRSLPISNLLQYFCYTLCANVCA